jgi:small subunit ribosomal protein S1
VVSNLTTFGAFIDLGGADGLVHVSELSYNRVNHPGEVLHVGQEVDVYVLSVDKETKKIALSLKRALPDPWTTVDQRYRVGEVVPAVITKLAKFGAFAKVEEGLEGLIHLSELTDMAVQDAAQVVHEGQQVDVKIIHINSQRRRLGLSVRQAVEPQEHIESFGDLEVSPWAAAAYELAAAEPYEPEASSPYESRTSLSEHLSTGEQDSPAAESEPQTLATPVNGSVAAPPEEAPPASPEATQLFDEEVAATKSETDLAGVSAARTSVPDGPDSVGYPIGSPTPE